MQISDKGLVVDALAESGKYEKLHPLFKKAFDFLRTTDLKSLAPGRHELEGDRLYVNIDEVELKPYAEGGKLEAHRRYIDIQVPIMCDETMGFLNDPEGVGAHAAEFNVERDFVLYENPAMRPITVRPGEFVIFFPPYAAHMPCRTVTTVRKVRKAIVKVLVEY